MIRVLVNVNLSRRRHRWWSQITNLTAARSSTRTLTRAASASNVSKVGRLNSQRCRPVDGHRLGLGSSCKVSKGYEVAL